LGKWIEDKKPKKGTTNQAMAIDNPTGGKKMFHKKKFNGDCGFCGNQGHKKSDCWENKSLKGMTTVETMVTAATNEPFER
jgi:hypothetical protein